MQRKASTFKFIVSLITLVRPYSTQFGLGLLALFLGSAMNLALPQLAKLLIDNHFRELVVMHPLSSALALAGLFETAKNENINISGNNCTDFIW